MNEASFSNLQFLEQQYRKYLEDPQSVDLSWRYFFEGWDLASHTSFKTETPSSWKVERLIEAYRKYGHLKACINPLSSSPTPEVIELSLSYHGFKSEDLETHVPSLGFLSQPDIALKDLILALEKTYCGFIGIEYMDLGMSDLERWIQKTIEPDFTIPFSQEQKLFIFQELNQAAVFENFLHTKFAGQTWFSLEGGETFMPMLKFFLEAASEENIDEVVIGMAHRGRLNVLAHLCNKPYLSIFKEFSDYLPDPQLESGDVKYHQGFTGQISTQKGKTVKVTLAPNPSHLESVDPIVIGQARAKQDCFGKAKVIPILVHGDASIAGQGIIYETAQMSRLKGYETEGTLHIVINNQIGFTTLPKDGRSTRYCTDIALAFKSPVFHVNADKPEECVYAMMLALKIRQAFKCDVFIDLNCYRKYGHNEGDEPAFTQPIEYQLIKSKESIPSLYQKELIQQSILDVKTAQNLETKMRQTLEEAFAQATNSSQTNTSISYEKRSIQTPIFKSIDRLSLQQLGKEFCSIPNGFNLHPKIQKLLETRLQMLEGPSTEKKIDWGMAEHLAFSILLKEGTSIRFSGQDSCRGTFSHRHAVWIDQKIQGQEYCPLAHLKDKQATFTIFNSPLSEFSVLGFEFGYSLLAPKTLVIWEAQFGDFINEAQVIIDQYICSCRQKWGIASSLTLLLPHGYEGKGPEHSSARMERFLQLSANSNWRLVNCTTPSQFFHILYQQGKLSDLRPLVVFTPKGLLRHPQAVSSLDELTQQGFQPIIDDDKASPKKILLCSGKVYYDLLAERKSFNAAIIRIEQLYPFPEERFFKIVEKYKGVTQWCWVQEESQNSGAWSYIFPLIQKLIHHPLIYVGRSASASTAVGSYALHKKEYTEIIQQAYKED